VFLSLLELALEAESAAICELSLSVEGWTLKLSLVEELVIGDCAVATGCSQNKFACNGLGSLLESSLAVIVVLLEFSRVPISVLELEDSTFALALLPKTFIDVSILVGHHSVALVESALEAAIVAVAMEDFSALAMLHVVLPLPFIHRTVLLEVH
jgi:hypothetical protein